MALFPSVRGLLLVLVLVCAPQVNGFAPTGGLSVKTSTSSLSAFNVGASMLEDKPHLLLGGRGYRSSNLVIDQAEYDDAMEESARRLRTRLMKAAAAYTAVVAGSLCMRQCIALLAYFPYFYSSYPLAAAMATCGFKSMFADFLSQMKSWNGRYCIRRSLSGLAYGALVLGVGSKLAYTQVLPRICPSGAVGAVVQCVLDNFVLAPMIWIPGAYVSKALFFQFPLKEAMVNYLDDIKVGGLLQKYWKLWVPAQLLNFSIMPQHLRVPFVAGVGFLWFMILMSLTHKKD